MQEGGSPSLEVTKKILQDEINELETSMKALRENPTVDPNITKSTTYVAMEQRVAQLKQQLANIDAIAGGSSTTGATSSVKIPSTAEEAVAQNLYGNLFNTNKRTYEDVLKQPGVQRIYADLEKMIDQAGIGNVKDTKATGTQAATGVVRMWLPVK